MITRPSSIVEAFLRVVERTPDTLAVTFEGRAYRHGELLALADRWANAFGCWGLSPGERVALFLENSPDFLAAYLGAHLAGGIVVLVNTQYRQVELRHILGDSGARLCIADTAGLSELERVTGELPQLEKVVVAGTDEEVAFLDAGHASTGDLDFA